MCASELDIVISSYRCLDLIHLWPTAMVTGSRAEPVRYPETLRINVRRRSLGKTKDIGDPNAYSAHDLSAENLPSVRTTDIFNYLVLLTSFCTGKRFKAYKSFDSFKYFLSGFVSCVAVTRKAEDYVVLGKVKLFI